MVVAEHAAARVRRESRESAARLREALGVVAGDGPTVEELLLAIAARRPEAWQLVRAMVDLATDRLLAEPSGPRTVPGCRWCSLRDELLAIGLDEAVADDLASRLDEDGGDAALAALRRTWRRLSSPARDRLVRVVVERRLDHERAPAER